LSGSPHAVDKGGLKPGGKNREQLERTLWVTAVGAVVDLLLAVGKIIVSVALSVHAVFADGVHSLSDLLSDGILMLLVRLSHRPHSRTRPYRHALFGCLLRWIHHGHSRGKLERTRTSC